jgi:hypothetical protein
MFELAEYNDMDALELEALLVESVKESVEHDARQELMQLAQDVQDAYGETESELIDALTATALTNPISETAHVLMEEATALLM